MKGFVVRILASEGERERERVKEDKRERKKDIGRDVDDRIERGRLKERELKIKKGI